jgi:P-type Ca2+ transporter type 2C
MSGSTVVTSSSHLDSPSSDAEKPPSSGSGATAWMSEEDPLQAEPGSESDFIVDDNRFAFSPGQLNKLLNPKSLPAYAALGGIRGIEKGLRTNLRSGLSVDETHLHGTINFEEATGASYDSFNLESGNGSSTSNNAASTTNLASKEAFTDRIRIFRKNVLPEKKATPLWKLVWRAYLDKVLLLLTAAAIISLALGLYETLGVAHEKGQPMPIDWVVSWIASIPLKS